jgi:hypothetical protein
LKWEAIRWFHGDDQLATKTNDAPRADRTTITHALELLAEHGFGGMAEALELLLNEAMKIERPEDLGAAPYERTDSRRGDANGLKPKTVLSRLGKHGLSIALVRETADVISLGAFGLDSVHERNARDQRAQVLASVEPVPSTLRGHGQVEGHGERRLA